MPNAGRITKATLTDLYDLRIKNQWIQGYGEPEHEYQKIYREETIQTEDTRYSYISGFGQWQQLTGATLTFDSIYQGYDVTITPYEYALAYTIDQVTVEDDPQGLLGGQLATSLAQAGRETLETLAAVPFNAPTSTTYASPWQSGGDGVALLGAHTILAGGTYSNMPSSHADLSVATLKASRTRMEKMPNARGLRWKMDGKTLVVPTDSRWLAGEILGSEKMPYTADNTPNLVKDGIELVVWSRLTDTDSWFVLAKKANSLSDKGHMATCVMRIKPQFDRDNVFETGDRRYKGRMRVGFGFPDWRGIDGSTGG